MREYSHMTVPFTNLLKGKGCKSNQPISWNLDLDKVFNALKLKVKNAPVLALPDPSRPYILETDASDYALGAALFQDGNPVAFESKKFDDTQIKWPYSQERVVCRCVCTHQSTCMGLNLLF